MVFFSYDYPYKYFKEDLPTKNKFYSTLTNCEIIDKSY